MTLPNLPALITLLGLRRLQVTVYGGGPEPDRWPGEEEFKMPSVPGKYDSEAANGLCSLLCHGPVQHAA